MSYHRLHLALQIAREKSGQDISCVDSVLSQAPGLSYVPGSLSDWERGLSCPDSETLYFLLRLYRSDLYDFMDFVLFEEMHPYPG